jgi:hypothetical protein
VTSTLVVETGAGTPNANSYVTVAFVTRYLQDRGREAENDWLSTSLDLQEAACVAATDYIDKRWGPSFKGTPIATVINGRAAKGTLQLGGLPLDTELFTLGQIAYRLVAAIAQENDVLIEVTVEDTLVNLANAVVGGEGRDEKYHQDTRLNFEASAGIDGDDPTILNVTARMAGENGNAIVFTTTITGATISGSGTLEKGLDTGAQPLAFPKANLFGPKGEPIVGIPLKLKQATAEYAVRALEAALVADPTHDARGVAVQSFSEKVGPIEERTDYVQGAMPRVFAAYPAADALLSDYVLPGGRTFR